MKPRIFSRDVKKEGLVHKVDNAAAGSNTSATAVATTAGTWTLSGACAGIYPVSAVKVADGRAVVDEEWCINCRLYGLVCLSAAITVRRRSALRAQRAS